jgi:hypothetical protein
MLINRTRFSCARVNAGGILVWFQMNIDKIYFATNQEETILLVRNGVADNVTALLTNETFSFV